MKNSMLKPLACVILGLVTIQTFALAGPSPHSNDPNGAIATSYKLTSGTYELKWNGSVDVSTVKGGDDMYSKQLRFLFKRLPKFKSPKPRLVAFQLDGTTMRDSCSRH